MPRINAWFKRPTKVNKGEDVEFRILPFPHQVRVSTVSGATEHALLTKFDSMTWERRECTFYRLDVAALALENSAVRDILAGDSEIGQQCAPLQETFRCRLSSNFRFELHRYSQGCGIGPHTDARPSEVRQVINLNRGWKQADGGVWILSSDSALRVHRAFLPSISNTGFAFLTSRHSFHALCVYSGPPIYCITLRYPLTGLTA